ncbi:MAG: hypothetical protein U9Q95_05530 [Candidatus Eisenbacteria bacterium]|nr:hypothetical protein [Candidatus Eisenbacteria bacterium]
MNSILTRLAVLCVVALLASVASADVLWDQPYDPGWAMGYFNSESGGPPMGMTWHGANDVTAAAGWNVDSITSFYSAVDPAWGTAITQGYLHVFPKTGALPVEDPTMSPLVAMSGVLVGDHFEVTASGLGLYLAPGEYWLGLTPIAPSGPMGPEIQTSAATMLGSETVSYDAYGMPMPMWFVFNPGLDAAMVVQGTIAGTPVEETTWGSVKAMYR